jgi:molecular chaperone GrpE
MSMSDTENSHPHESEAEDAMTDLTDDDGAADDAATTPVGDDIIVKLNAELEATRDRLLRAVAESENTRKRAEKEVRDTRDYSVSSFAKDMLDISDSLSRAVTAVDEAALAAAPDSIRNLVEGVAMTERALLSKMERHGVRKVDPQPGDHFDPHKHQAVAQIPSEYAAGTIAAVMQTGFVIGERTLRAAMVAVSAGHAADGAPQGSGEPGDTVDMKA